MPPTAFPAFKEFLLFRAGWIGSISERGWHRICEQGTPILPFGKQARKIPSQSSCMASWGDRGDALKPNHAELVKGGL